MSKEAFEFFENGDEPEPISVPDITPDTEWQERLEAFHDYEALAWMRVKDQVMSHAEAEEAIADFLHFIIGE